MRYASVCSGVESASLAWEPLGWKPVWFSEIEPFPSAVLAARFPNVPNLGDMTKIKGEEYDGAVDLLVGGTPCQGFSVAGKQGGLDDPRSVLCLTYVGLLKTMRPTWFVWENVPGVFSTADGEDFRSFIRAIDEIGYSCAWRVLDAQYVRVDGYPRAVPQRRRRVFVVGHISGDWRYPASVLFEPDSVQRDTPPRRIKGKGFAGDAENRIGTASGRLWDPSGGRNEDGVVMSIGNGQVNTAMRPNQEFSNTPHCMHDHEIILDGRDVVCLNDQGGSMMKIEKDATVGTLRANAHGNEPIICAHETGQGFWQGGEIAGTLRAEGENRPSRPSNIICRATQQGNAETMTDCCPTITEAAGTSGNNQPIICAGFCQGASPAAGSIGYHEQVSPTIKAGESGTAQVPALLCVHGSQDPIVNPDHANAVNRNNGLENCVCYENHAQDSRVKSLDGVCSQISAKAGTGGGNLPLVQTYSCYPINSMVIGKDIKDGDRQTTGIGSDGEPCPTLQAAHHHAVAIAENIIGRKIENGGNGIGAQEELAYTQNACGVMGVAQGCDAYNHQLTGDVAVTINANSCNSANHAGPSIINSSTVRRLLPVECERLMGFPDNWTRIPWKGKPVEDCPDSPRYKACGNSMCVNVMRWIGMKIEMVERKTSKEME